MLRQGRVESERYGVRHEGLLSFVQPAFMHSACHASIFVF